MSTLFFVPLRGLILGLSASLILSLGATQAPAQVEKRPEDLSDLAESLTESVVNISTSQIIESDRAVPLPDLPEGSPFQEFFDRFFDRNDRDGQPRKSQSLGSGFIIDAKGIIVTNNHVIEGADEIFVSLSDGTELPAVLLGTDPRTDIAVLEVQPEAPLPAVAFGDSDKLRLAEWVIAIGNPFGLGGTVTVGVVSARNRHIDSSNLYDNFIQTDASINKGNSGGPLFNLSGEVIGINTAIISPTGTSVGIAFAIPSNVATVIVNQLIEFGETRRGWLGVYIQSVTEDIAAGLDLEEARGALVSRAAEEGPAEEAGIEIGDIILSFDGKEIQESSELPAIVAETRVGKVVDVEIIRNGEKKTLSVEVGHLEAQINEESEDEEEMVEEGDPDLQDNETKLAELLGLGLGALDSASRREFEINEAIEEGLVVLAVDPLSSAAEKGFQPGNVIIEIDQSKVKTVKEALDKVETLIEEGRKAALLLVQVTPENQRFIGLPLPVRDQKSEK